MAEGKVYSIYRSTKLTLLTELTPFQERLKHKIASSVYLVRQVNASSNHATLAYLAKKVFVTFSNVYLTG